MGTAKFRSVALILGQSLIVFALFGSCLSDPYHVQRREDRQRNRLGLLTLAEVTMVCDELMGGCLKSKAFDDYYMSLSRMPAMLVSVFRNDSTDELDVAMMADQLEPLIRKSGKAAYMSAEGRYLFIPEETNPRFQTAIDRESLEILQNSPAECLLTGHISTFITKKNVKAIRNFHIYAELLDIKTGRLIWRGQHNTIKKVIRTGPVKKEVFKENMRKTRSAYEK
jgi:hypothetical protein